MSGLYIPNMNYPKVGEVICVFPNGKVQKRIVELSTLYEVVETSEAIPVPDHGRLIDADALQAECVPEPTFVAEMLFRKVNNAPTIIPADKEDGE